MSDKLQSFLQNPPCGSAGIVQLQPTLEANFLAWKSPTRKRGDRSSPAFRRGSWANFKQIDSSGFPGWI